MVYKIYVAACLSRGDLEGAGKRAEPACGRVNAHGEGNLAVRATVGREGAIL